MQKKFNPYVWDNGVRVHFINDMDVVQFCHTLKFMVLNFKNIGDETDLKTRIQVIISKIFETVKEKDINYIKEVRILDSYSNEIDVTNLPITDLLNLVSMYAFVWEHSGLTDYVQNILFKLLIEIGSRLRECLDVGRFRYRGGRAMIAYPQKVDYVEIEGYTR